VPPAPTFASAFLADKDRIMKPEPDTFPSATANHDTVVDALWSGSAAKRALVRLLALCILPFCLMPSLARAQATLLSEYRFNDVAWCTPVSALDTVGGRNGTLVGGVAWEDSPASGAKPVNGAATRIAGGGAIDITGLPFNLAPGAQNSVSFWMLWDGTDNVMPMGFGLHDLWLQSGSFGFNTFNSDIFGISSAGLANGWHHVTAVFTNGNVAANKLWIDGVPQVMTQRQSVPNNANAVVSAHMRLSGVWGNAGYQFRGALDEVRVYSGLITQAQVDADRAVTSPAVVCPPPPPPTLVAHYRLDDNWDTTHTAVNSVSGGPVGTFLTTYATKVATPAVSPNKPNTCSGAAFAAGNGSMRSTGVSLDLGSGAKNSVSFWMYWNGGDSQMPFGFARHDLWLQGGSFGFNTGASDIFGISSAGLANGWHHVAAVFTNGNVADNKLWIDGVAQTLTQRQSAPNNANAYAANTFQLSSWTNDNNYRFVGRLDELKVYRGALTDAMVLNDSTAICVVATWQMDEASWNGTANEVKDSGSGQYHGRARIAAGSTSVPTTAFASPARTSGSTSTCGYGEFDKTTAPVRTYSYVELASFPPLPSSFTFAAWIRSTSPSTSGQRILVRDDAQNGWGFSLGDPGQAKIRFFNRNITNSGAVTGQGTNPGCGVFCLDTNAVITANNWFYVAVSIDTVGKIITLYVFDATGTMLVSASSAFSGTWADGTGLAAIGGETSASAEGRQAGFHFRGNIDEMQIFSGVLSQIDIQTMLNRTRACSATPSVPPANFNCVESGADASTGHLYTKLVGAAFSFDVAALKADGTVETTYASDVDKPVTVELVDGSGATACASRTAISPAVSQTLTFAAANAGRKAAAAMTVNKAYANLRCRVTDANQAPSIVGCSTDNFSVRPLSLQPASSANADGAGVSGTATPAVRAGASFSLTATALPGYDGTPKVDSSKLAAHGGAIQAGSLGGSFGAGNPGTGVATGNFAYSEVGYFNFAANGIYDDTYTAVDSTGDCTNDFSNSPVGGKYGCLFGNTSTTSYFGRFIPDHFTVVTPVPFAAGCPAGGFSYMDQPFSTALSASIEARNTVNAKTQNYNGATFGKGTVSAQMENGNSGTPIPGARLGGAGAPSWTSGAYAFTATRFSRPAAGVIDGAYDALDIGVVVTDSDNVYLVSRNMDASNTSCTADTAGTSDGTCTAVTLVAATRVRFGTLKLDNAYGSELLPLRVPLRAMYWNGTAWVTNTVDSCTTITNQRDNFAIGNQQGTLTAGNYGATKVPAAALPLINGLGTLVLAAPNAGTSGGLDIALNLGATAGDANCIGGGFPAATAGASLAWLRGKWCGTDFARDPNVRVRFGSPKAPYIYLRERY
jgi:MSHA biogenesis protein MshQ